MNYLERSGIVSIIFAVTAAAYALLPYGMIQAAEPAKGVRVCGTGSAITVMKEMAAAFKKKNPDAGIRVITPPLGSTGGIKALMNGDLEIAISARDLKEEEKKTGLTAIEYGRSPFVFVARPENSLSDITLSDAAAIYLGKKTVWPDNTPIRLVIRPPSDSHSVAVEELSPEMKEAVERAQKREGLPLVPTDDENADVLEKTPGAFGVMALTQLIAEKRRLKPLSLNMVAPTAENMANGAYPFVNKGYLIIREKPSPATQEFVDFVLSMEGKEILKRTGYLVK